MDNRFFFFIFSNFLEYTNIIKPICQVVSHIPQLYETYNKKSTEGLSLTTQHLNLLGGLAGVYMHSVIPPVSFMTRLVYINSMFQAISLYYMAIYYDGWKRIWTSMNYSQELYGMMRWTYKTKSPILPVLSPIAPKSPVSASHSAPYTPVFYNRNMSKDK